MAETTRRLLVFAYSCAPDQGSEPGAGWGMVQALAENTEVVVLVGARHAPSIRKWEESAPQGGPRFISVPEPFLEPYMKWHRIPRFLVYLRWLRTARKRAAELIASGEFDAVAHVTFSAYWLPTPATELGIPSIWGPVGGAVSSPRTMWRMLGPVGLLQEALDFIAVRTMGALSGARTTARQATVRVVQNEDTLQRLPSDARDRLWVLNHALFAESPPAEPAPDGRYALWVSPMESRKGPRLAVEALARTQSGARMVMVGDGPQRRRLERLAADLGVADRITFTGWVDRSEAVAYMSGATTALFTGMREEGGLALAEAMRSARRLIVLDHGGAGAIARRSTDPDRVALIRAAAPDATAAAMAAAIDRHFAEPEPGTGPLLDRDAAVADLTAAIDTALKTEAERRSGR